MMLATGIRESFGESEDKGFRGFDMRVIGELLTSFLQRIFSDFFSSQVATAALLVYDNCAYHLQAL